MSGETTPGFAYGDDFVRVGEGNHEVKPGECMSSIASEHGFFWETLWEHPSNAELKRVREDPNVLMPGDRVFVPPLRQTLVSADVDRRHRFRRRGVPEKIRLRFFDSEMKPRANTAYQLELGDDVLEDETDGDGFIEVWVQPRLTEARLRFVDPETKRILDYFELDIGHLPPIDSGEGIAARLANLGLFNSGQDVAEALVGFQQDHELEPSGTLDDATRDKLLELAGS